ncbi:hypothetical protein BJX61DRAFT_279883 [Aspergillus egyptiacus]|nr:hypothetical protein BJX61DRAFT_279883 [Aspergillus egyptiacus]
MRSYALLTRLVLYCDALVIVLLLSITDAKPHHCMIRSRYELPKDSILTSSPARFEMHQDSLSRGQTWSFWRWVRTSMIHRDQMFESINLPKSPGSVQSYSYCESSKFNDLGHCRERTEWPLDISSWLPNY